MTNRNDKICNVEDAGQAKGLAERATVQCGRCGAKAHDAANVCVPEKLSGEGGLGG